MTVQELNEQVRWLKDNFDPRNEGHLEMLCAIYKATRELWEMAGLDKITEVPYILTKNPFSNN